MKYNFDESKRVGNEGEGGLVQFEFSGFFFSHSGKKNNNKWTFQKFDSHFLDYCNYRNCSVFMYRKWYTLHFTCPIIKCWPMFVENNKHYLQNDYKNTSNIFIESHSHSSHCTRITICLQIVSHQMNVHSVHTLEIQFEKTHIKQSSANTQCTSTTTRELLIERGGGREQETGIKSQFPLFFFLYVPLRDNARQNQLWKIRWNSSISRVFNWENWKCILLSNITIKHTKLNANVNAKKEWQTQEEQQQQQHVKQHRVRTFIAFELVDWRLRQ